MALKVSMLKSAPTSINKQDGFSLKKGKLKKWIYEKGFTQPYVAKELGLRPEEFKRKLSQREKFTKEQIQRLILLMSAEDAFKVLYFPTRRQRNEVWWSVFGKYKRKEELNE